MFEMLWLFPQSNFLPNPKLFLWDIESDNLQYFNLETGKLDIHDIENAEASGDKEQLTPSSAPEQ
jgi:hypothetical protein